MKTAARSLLFIALSLALARGGAWAQDPKPYKVVEGYKVDAVTMTGFRTWRAAACDRCHGANQEGLVGPSLLNSMKTLSKDEFVKTVRDGRLDKGMVAFSGNKQVMDNLDALYAYLKGRSDGAITRARVEPMAGGDDAMRARARLAGVFAVLALAAGAARAQLVPDDSPRTALKVCQEPNNLPFANLQGEGYENRIAELMARELGLPLRYFSFPNRLAFIRNTLRYRLPGEDYRCDVVLGVPAGFDQVSVTRPYYRSTYALVFAKGKGMDGVRDSDDLLALPAAAKGSLRIGVFDRSPASLWLARHDLVDRGVPYPIMSPDPDQYPGQLIERDLAQGRIDAAIVWGPIAGYFARRVRLPELVVVPMKSEPGLPFEFSIAMGVRHGEPQWKQRIEGFVARNQPQIEAILREYGVPLVPDPVAAKQP